MPPDRAIWSRLRCVDIGSSVERRDVGAWRDEYGRGAWLEVEYVSASRRSVVALCDFLGAGGWIDAVGLALGWAGGASSARAVLASTLLSSSLLPLELADCWLECVSDLLRPFSLTSGARALTP